MSEDAQVVDNILSESDPAKVLEMAISEVKRIFSATGESLAVVCTAVENASSRVTLEEALKRFNRVLHVFLGLSRAGLEESAVLNAVGSLLPSGRFKDLLTDLASLPEALSAYKTSVVKDLAANLRRKADLFESYRLQDCALLDTLLPEPTFKEAPKQKRGISEVIEDDVPPPSLKRSRTIPALASVGLVSGSGDTFLSAKKTLLTRERLRAGLHDPKGLLNLVAPSSDALERATQLELMKSAGVCFDDNRRKSSFSEKFNAAT